MEITDVAWALLMIPIMKSKYDLRLEERREKHLSLTNVAGVGLFVTFALNRFPQCPGNLLPPFNTNL